MALPVAKKAHSRKGDILIALSLANLCFLNIWYLVEQVPARSLNYYRKTPPDATLLLATLLDVLILGGLFYGGWLLVVRSKKRLVIKLAQATFLAILSFPIEKLIDYLNVNGDRVSFIGCGALIVAETALLFGIMMLLFFDNRAVLRMAKMVTLLLALLFPSLAFDLTWAWASGPHGKDFDDPPVQSAATKDSPRQRVVWLIFDEMDQELAFDRRPPDLQLPNLDRLRGESFYADQAHPTARWTMVAMPSLILGKPLNKVELKGAADLEIWPSDQSQPSTWRSESNVFVASRQLGYNSGVIGWHHPYCRVLNNALTYCHWESSAQGSPEIEAENHCRRLGLASSMAFLLGWKVEDALTKLHLLGSSYSNVSIQESIRAAQLDLFLEIRRSGLAAIGDPKLDFVLVHWPAPHPFGIFNRHTGKISLEHGNDYLDNLALTDRTVGDVRSALEQAGLWDRTTLLISADHPLRPEMWREKIGWTAEVERALGGRESTTVPYILKLAGFTQPAVYHKRFNAVLTHDLILAAMKGQIHTGGDVTAWLDANRERYLTE